MIKITKKIILCITFFITGFTIQSQQQTSTQDAIALKMIEAMQGCIFFYEQAQQPLNALNISEQRSVWNKAADQYHKYIDSLRKQNPYIEKIASINLPASKKSVDNLMMQMNESKLLFAHLLDEYIAYLGQVYEKAGIFKNTYYIASNNNPTLSIMPNEYNLFVQTLQSAMEQSDWGTTINLTLPVIEESRLISEKNFTLNEILTAVRNVPLPVEYSTAAIIGGVAATAAIVGGAYYAFNNMNQLKDSINDIENQFNNSPIPTIENQLNNSPTPIVESKATVKDSINDVIPTPIIETEPSLIKKQLNAMNDYINDEASFLHTFGSEAKTIPNWQANSDAELYGAPGLSDQEVLGVVGLGASTTLAGATSARYQAAQNAKKTAETIAQVKKNIITAQTTSDIEKAAEVQQYIAAQKAAEAARKASEAALARAHDAQKAKKTLRVIKNAGVVALAGMGAAAYENNK